MLISKYTDEHGYAPSLREICSMAHIQSTNAADDHLKTLQQKGYISRQPRIARSLRILRLPEEEKKTE